MQGPFPAKAYPVVGNQGDLDNPPTYCTHLPKYPKATFQTRNYCFPYIVTLLDC